MDRSIAARRKAQQLARDGELNRAIGEMERVLQGGETDPYDFVFHGDLLARGNRVEDAIASYEEAVLAYERVGLFRNAIAIAKKILRTDPARPRTHRRLGELYASEGLMGDAIAHFLIFLDRAGGEATGEEFLEVLERVAEIAGPKAEVALRLADLCARAGRADRAAMLLRSVADQAAAAGALDIALPLRERADGLDPGSCATPPEGPDPVADLAASIVEDMPRALEPCVEPPAPFGPPREPFSLDLTVEADLEISGATAAAGSPAEADAEAPAEDHERAEAGTARPAAACEGAEESATPGSGGSGGNGHEPRGGVFDLRPVADAALDPAAIEPAAIDPAARSAGDAETRTERERIERLLEERDFSLATDLLLRLHEEQPEQSWIVEKLIAAARGQGDRLAAVRYLTLLGDLRINEEDLEGSLDCFLQVLDIERENATACRRLARFREMRVRGWERIPDTVEGEASPPPRRVPLTVLEQEGTGGPEWVDLSTLLEEFRAGVRSQFRPDDVEGHYDLGVSHQEMGLYEEAIEEFDFVLAVPSLPPGRAAQAREMRGICLERLGRTEEASSEYRRILGQDPAESPNAAGVRYRLACLLEASGEIEEARQLFRALSIEHAAFPDLEERLQRLGG